MPLITVALVIVAVGVIAWLVNTYIPMEAMMKRVFNIVVVVATCIWLMKVFGLWDYLAKVKV